MLSRNPGKTSLILSAIAASFLVCFAYFAYHTGCTADLKTGTFGDPREAIRFSNISSACFAAGIISGSLALGVIRGIQPAARIGVVALFVVLGGVVFWHVGAALEVAGVQDCSRPNNSFKPNPLRGSA